MMSKPDPIAIAKAELADYEAQIAAAQNDAQQAQAALNAAQQRFLMASGALQATNALLAKLDTPPTEADPAS